MPEVTITLESHDEELAVFGSRDQFLRQVRDAFGVKLVARHGEVRVEGDTHKVEQARQVLEELKGWHRRRRTASAGDVAEMIENRVRPESDEPGGTGEIRDGNKVVRARTDGQARYVACLRDHELVFCVGPAGTGKTYLAVAQAVAELRRGKIKKIVLVRPAVEAGEHLGFLPGDLEAKINPYLRPLLDALHDLMDYDQIRRYMGNDLIEIAPLAYMRGRAQPLGSQVLTPRGFRPFGTLKVGDEVIGSDGQPTRVEGVYPQGVKPVYRVTFSDGSSTRCCGEHLWTVQTRDDRRRGRGSRVLETRGMLDQLRCAHYHRYELPLISAPVAFPAVEVPIDPYALGLLLGDGCMTGATTPGFTTADTELAASINERVPEVELIQKSAIDSVMYRRGRIGRTTNPVTGVLRDLGLRGTRSHTKFIPDVFLINAPEVRLSVLQGLLDSDGGPVTQSNRTCRIQYTTTSSRLRDDVLFLVRSLGGVARWRTRAAEGRTPGFANGRPVGYRNDAFVLEIRLPDGVQPFRLARKQARYEEFGGGRPMRYVHDITPDGEEETACIRVAAGDSLYATDDFILTHNTLNDAVIILDEGQNATVPQMKMFLTRMGQNARIVVTGDTSQVDLPPETVSGLADAVERLRNVPGIGVATLDRSDIVRHPLVQAIVNAYEETEPNRRTDAEPPQRAGSEPPPRDPGTPASE